jgi:hypothetical protein
VVNVRCLQQRKPDGVEKYLYMKNFDKYRDPDGDEAELEQLIIQKKERRKQLKEQLAASS